VSWRPTIWGAVERGGRVKARVVKSRATEDVEMPIYEYVMPSSVIFTDEWLGYRSDHLLRRFQGHRRIRHEDRVHVSGDVHTQSIEGFFGLMKNGIRGTYPAVSSNWLQGYLNEYAWRYNHRSDERAQFESLLLRSARR
jgi:transposase